jgi:tetratricopeptide (TPR) repeat protein
LAVAYYAVSGSHLTRGEHDKAIPILLRARQLSIERIQQYRPGVAGMLGLAYARAGRAPEAIPLLEEGVAGTRLTSRRLEPYRRVSLAIGYLANARIVEARVEAEKALHLARSYRSTFTESWALQTLAEITLADDKSDARRALELANQALKRSLLQGTRPLSAHCHLTLGRAYRKARDLRRSEEHLARAVKMYQQMGMPNWLAVSHRPSGSMSSRPGVQV